MAARDVIKNQTLFVDGRGYAGQLTEVNPPKLNLMLEEYRGGGMDAAVDITMGMEKLVADFSLISYDRDVLALFGVAEGNSVPFTVREVLESFDGTTTAVIHNMRGKIIGLDSGTHTPGQPAPLKVDVSLTYYKQTHGGVVVHEIDVPNMVRIINGVDSLAGQRRALGI